MPTEYKVFVTVERHNGPDDMQVIGEPELVATCAKYSTSLIVASTIRRVSNAITQIEQMEAELVGMDETEKAAKSPHHRSKRTQSKSPITKARHQKFTK